MKTFTNTQLIESRAKWAKRLAPLTMLFLIGGLITNFISINQPQYFRPTLLLLAIGFTLSIFSSNLVNTWVREPRTDQALAAILKKFGNDFILFNYTAPVPHVLLTPRRLYVIVARRQAGQVTVTGSRVSRKFTFMRLLRFFTDEGMGAPISEAQGKVDKLRKHLTKEMAAEEIPDIQPLVIFTNKEIDLTVNEPAIPVMHINRLKRHLREHDKTKEIPAAQRRTLTDHLSEDHPETGS